LTLLENLDKADELLPSARVRNSALMDSKSENFDSQPESSRKLRAVALKD
jgi:hypothetical protein